MEIKLSNPFRASEPRKPPPPRLGARELGKLYALGVLLVIILGTMIFFQFRGRRAAPAPGPKEEAVVTVPERREEPDSPEEDRPLPQADEEAAQARAAEFKDGTAEVDRDSEAFRYFLNLFATRLDSAAVKSRVTPGVGAQTILADPGAHRGKYFRFYGRMIQLFTEPLKYTTPSGMREVYVGYMQSHPDGRTVCFYLPERPRAPFKTIRKGAHEYIDNWVVVEGIFLRAYQYEGKTERADDKGLIVVAAVVFAKDVAIAEPPKTNDARRAFIVIVAVVGAVVVGLIILAGIMSRKYGGVSLREQRLAALREKATAAAGTSDPILGDEVKKPPA